MAEPRWRIYRYWKSGMSLVTYQMDTVDTIEQAFQWAADRGIINNKKRGVLYKREGDKRRIYSYEDWHRWYGWSYHPPEPPPSPPEPDEPPPQQLPLLDPFNSVWRDKPPTKRRL